MSLDDPDHGLPLVALKEQRRDLIMSLVDHRGPLGKDTIAEISALQTAIAAIEDVIHDLDCCTFSWHPAQASSQRSLIDGWL